MRNIVITGATGFIGGQILAKLANGPNYIIAIVRASDNNHAQMRLDRFNQKPNISVIAGDLRLPGLGIGTEILDGTDTFIHCAAEPKLGQRNEQRLRELHVDSVREIARLCSSYSIRRLIHFSTAYVAPAYEKPLGRESSITLGCNTYERTKAEGERVLLEEFQGYLDIVRPGIVLPALDQMEETLPASPVGQFLDSVKYLADRISNLPGRESVRLGLIEIEQVVDFVESLLSRHDAGVHIWNLVHKSISLGELRSEYCHLSTGSAPNFSTDYPRFLEPWAPYLLQERNWDTLETQVYADKMGIRYRAPSVEVFRQIFSEWLRIQPSMEVAS